MSELRFTHVFGPLCVCDACRKDQQRAQVITPPWQPPLFEEKSIHELQDALAAMTADRNAARSAMQAMAEHESDGLEYALVVVLKADLEKMTVQRDEAVKRADELTDNEWKTRKRAEDAEALLKDAHVFLRSSAMRCLGENTPWSIGLGAIIDKLETRMRAEVPR